MTVKKKRRPKVSKPMTVEMPVTGTALIAVDNPWKSLGHYSDPHCHTWQRGRHIDSLPTAKKEA
jgi:hypothetical protein